MKQFKYIISLVICAISVLLCSAQSYEMYVGDDMLLVCPDVPSGGAVYNTAWGANHKAIQIISTDNYSCRIKIAEYFTDIAQVQCDYYWMWYDQYGHGHTNHATTYYNIYCKAVNLELSEYSLILSPGEGKQIDYKLSPNVGIAKIRFLSNNSSVASVNDNGYVYAKGPGQTTITVENSAGPSAYCSVYVKEINPTEVSIPSAITTYVDESKTIEASFYPSNSSSSLSWYSDDSGVASVNSGVIRGVSEGETDVYVVTDNGLRSNNCHVTVRYRTATGINIGSTSISMGIGETRQLNYNIIPANAKAEVEWSSSNKNVVTVSQSGVLKAIGRGHATIKIVTDNGYSDVCDIEVHDDDYHILVWSKDGEYATFSFADKPVIKFDSYDREFVVSSDNETIYYNETEIAKITLSDANNPLNVNDIKSDSIMPCIKLDHYKLELSKCKPFSEISIYSIDGVMILQSTTDENGCSNIYLSGINTGIYIIKIEQLTFKILIK